MRVPIPIQMSITLVMTWFDLTRYFLLVGRSFAPQGGRAELKIGDSCVIKKEGGFFIQPGAAKNVYLMSGNCFFFKLQHFDRCSDQERTTRALS